MFLIDNPLADFFSWPFAQTNPIHEIIKVCQALFVYPRHSLYSYDDPKNGNASVEENFKLNFEDEEVSGVVTVDDFYQLILKSLGESSKLNNSNKTRCLTSEPYVLSITKNLNQRSRHSTKSIISFFPIHLLMTHEIQLYETDDGKVPFSKWLNSLNDRKARTKIRIRLDRLKLGNLGDCKSVGEGVYESRIDYGPGYRVYFGQVGLTIVLLLCGGDKSTQPEDIRKAKAYWNHYRRQ